MILAASNVPALLCQAIHLCHLVPEAPQQMISAHWGDITGLNWTELASVHLSICPSVCLWVCAILQFPIFTRFWWKFAPKYLPMEDALLASIPRLPMTPISPTAPGGPTHRQPTAVPTTVLSKSFLDLSTPSYWRRYNYNSLNIRSLVTVQMRWQGMTVDNRLAMLKTVLS